MKKRLSISDIFLLTLSGVLDFFEEVKDPGGLIASYYQNFYGFVPARWQKTHLKKTISYNLKTGKIKRNKQSLKLTPQGVAYLQQSFPLFFSKKKSWDGYWRLIIFDVGEIKRHHRDYLRAILKQQNFGMLQKSVWITPHPLSASSIEQFINRFHLKKEIITLKIRFENKQIEKEIVNRCWPIETINFNYKKITEKINTAYQEFQKTNNLEKLKENFAKFKKELYQQILHDPFLPTQFLPSLWYYHQAIKMKKKTARIIKLKRV